MRFGYWIPVFGGWLRNVRDEGMTIAWPYIRDLAAQSERHGFEVALIAELNLNDIKGHRAPSLDCWTLAPAIAAVTERLELMLAVRPNYHAPSLTAKALSTLDTIAPGRLSLNVVSSWWREEAAQYGMPFDVHDARYARTQEPKAKEVIAGAADAYVMHGDEPAVIAGKIADMSARRAQAGKPPLAYGVSGYVICRDTGAQAQAELERILDVKSSPAAYASYQDFLEGSQLESRVSLEEYSVSNRGLRTGLVGTPEQITARLRAYQDAGVDLMLLQFSPQREEMARFGRDVIASYPGPAAG